MPVRLSERASERKPLLLVCFLDLGLFHCSCPNAVLVGHCGLQVSHVICLKRLWELLEGGEEWMSTAQVLVQCAEIGQLHLQLGF